MLDGPQIAKFPPFTDVPSGSVFPLFFNVLKRLKNDQLRFQWFKDGVEIGGNSLVIDSSRYQIDTKFILSQFMLHDLVPSDTGNYSCVVTRDQSGQFDVQWTLLQVKGRHIL